MQRLATSFVLGYHGCDQGTAEQVLGGNAFRHSTNAYDWLGDGVYFWEANPKRGLAFAEELKARGRGKIRTPAVVGAVIDLGTCLDVASADSIEMIRVAHASFSEQMAATGAAMPVNSPDLLRRYLDRAVIEHLRSVLLRQNAAIDTVRGIFIEGQPIYPTAGFYQKTHVQIAVHNLACIKGVFRVPADQLA